MQRTTQPNWLNIPFTANLAGSAEEKQPNPRKLLKRMARIERERVLACCTVRAGNFFSLLASQTSWRRDLNTERCLSRLSSRVNRFHLIFFIRLVFNNILYRFILSLKLKLRSTEKLLLGFRKLSIVRSTRGEKDLSDRKYATKLLLTRW
jgi:hypothetical protein